MEERFTEGWRAAEFVADEIAHEIPVDSALSSLSLEVTLHRRGTLTRRVCFADRLPQVLAGFCAEFPRAAAQYHPDSAYGFIAKIECACSRAGAPGCCMAEGQEPAVVTVVLSAQSVGVYEMLRAGNHRGK